MFTLRVKRSVGCLALLLTIANIDLFASFEAVMFTTNNAMLMLRNQQFVRQNI